MNWLLITQIVYFIILIYTTIRVIMDSEQPARTISFLLLLYFVPVFGILFYYFFGGNYRKHKMYSKKLIQGNKDRELFRDFLHTVQEEIEEEFPPMYHQFKSVSDLVYKQNEYLLSANHNLSLLINGESKFPRLKDDILAAKHYIHLQYFTFEDDKLGNDIVAALIQKVKEGVTVRLLYDFFGSIDLKPKWVNSLRESGIEVAVFHKVNRFTPLNRMNYRNHRKIVVIDGEIGYVGGLNVSDLYINSPEYPSKHFWRDTHLRMIGHSVWSLQQIFLSDWNFTANKNLKPNVNFFPQPSNHVESDSWVQIVSSGPDSNYPSILYAYIEAVHSAEKTILLSTPYFIPSQEFYQAIIMAALRGVNVQLLVPEHSDSWYANTAARSYYQGLLDAGVTIHFYTKGMFHAKTIVCDQCFSMVGTANLDYRSFDLNFEVNAMIFSQSFAKKMEDSFWTDTQDAYVVDAQEWTNRKKYIIFFEKVMALFGPLM